MDWLKKHKVLYEFHNYKTEGITAARLKEWSKQAGWETLLNKKSTTWRSLDEAVKSAPLSESEAIQLMEAHTSLIKRPVIELGKKLIAVGFDEEVYKKAFAAKALSK